MISFEAGSGGVTGVRADLLVLPCYAGPEPGRDAASAGRALGVDLVATLRAHGFRGEAGDTFATLSLGRLAAESVLFLGLGRRDPPDHGAISQAAMLAAGDVARAARAVVALPETV